MRRVILGGRVILIFILKSALMIIFGDSVDDFTTAGKLAYCDDSNNATYNKGICALTVENLNDRETKMFGDMTDPNVDKGDN